MFKNQKGISLTTMVITVIIIIIILTTLVFSGYSGIQSRKLNKLYTDLRTLSDSVAMYYLKNKELPVKSDGDYKITLTSSSSSDDVAKMAFVLNDSSSTSFEKSKLINPNDYDESTSSSSYYELDLGLLDDLSLNYTGTYVINTRSHTIYYASGVSVDNVRYYTLPYTYIKIN